MSRAEQSELIVRQYRKHCWNNKAKLLLLENKRFVVLFYGSKMTSLDWRLDKFTNYSYTLTYMQNMRHSGNYCALCERNSLLEKWSDSECERQSQRRPQILLITAEKAVDVKFRIQFAHTPNLLPCLYSLTFLYQRWGKRVKLKFHPSYHRFIPQALFNHLK